jgi:hypothetical protein
MMLRQRHWRGLEFSVRGRFTSADELPARAVTSSSAELKQMKEP